MNGQIALIIFGAAFVTLVLAGRGLSFIGRFGGAFVGAAALTGVLSFAFGYLAKAATDPLGASRSIPKDLKAAGLDSGAQWSPEQSAMAARITHATLLRVEQELSAADRIGDPAAALAAMDHLRPLFEGWGNQDSNQNAAPHRACRLAMGHLADGAIAVVRGARWYDRDRYKAAVDLCGK
ncbi:hypothetical protein METUNv1_01775 [Methyloversatilis universalis FAM5]|uniref:Transmembrane protein n=1 Tax=Methyloversatilis universalis (strain ATCC BAA-1314 / DSM 25237 / JCM 13912 / CCUG 52030 / FAM5) TaxID=1000565 RepID=F5RBY0_METUF|nr:hypothetical protein [Methyloversatilis universalis]EGK71997.1 hypothetical protein METUNv1_01775 [Methyloversatilis universalis FAM5]